MAARLTETEDVGFDAQGFAVHRECGERLIEEWTITQYKGYAVKQDCDREWVGDDGSDRECEGVWCDACDVEMTLETTE